MLESASCIPGSRREARNLDAPAAEPMAPEPGDKTKKVASNARASSPWGRVYGRGFDHVNRLDTVCDSGVLSTVRVDAQGPKRV